LEAALCAPEAAVCTPQPAVCAPQSSICAPYIGICAPPTGVCAPQPAVCACSNPDHPTWQRCGSHRGQSKSKFTLFKVNKTLILIGRTRTLSDMTDGQTDETDQRKHETDRRTILHDAQHSCIREYNFEKSIYCILPSLDMNLSNLSSTKIQKEKTKLYMTTVPNSKHFIKKWVWESDFSSYARMMYVTYMGNNLSKLHTSPSLGREVI
jgi:hypothetical protein